MAQAPNPSSPRGVGRGANYVFMVVQKLILLILLFLFSIEFLKSIIVCKIFTNYIFSCLKSTIDTLKTGIKYAPN